MPLPRAEQGSLREGLAGSDQLFPNLGNGFLRLWRWDVLVFRDEGFLRCLRETRRRGVGQHDCLLHLKDKVVACSAKEAPQPIHGHSHQPGDGSPGSSRRVSTTASVRKLPGVCTPASPGSARPGGVLGHGGRRTRARAGPPLPPPARGHKTRFLRLHKISDFRTF